VSPADAAEESDLAASMPAEHARAYDVKPVIKALLDEPGCGTARQVGANIVTTPRPIRRAARSV
jgi:acetyl-CoA/propionyl-CoA carboxylase carboxyl transferase subunit